MYPRSWKEICREGRYCPQIMKAELGVGGGERFIGRNRRVRACVVLAATWL
jgi:hypothetical protein